MKKLKSILLVSLFTFVGFSAFAQTKIAIVESQKIMENLPEYKGIIDQLSKIKESAEGEFAAKAQKFQEDVQDYQQKQAMLTAEKKKSTEAELGQRQQELAQYRDQKTQELQKKQMDLSKPLQDRILDAIELVAKKEGYSVVLDKSNIATVVLYSDDNLDITFRVLDFLKTNKATGKSAVKPPAKN